MNNTQIFLILFAIIIIICLIALYYYQKHKINQQIADTSPTETLEEAEAVLNTQELDNLFLLEIPDTPENKQNELKDFLTKYAKYLENEDINNELDYIALITMQSETNIKVLPADVNYYKSTNSRAYAVVNDELMLVNIDQIKIKTSKLLFVTPMINHKQLIDSISLHGLNQQIIAYAKKLRSRLCINDFAANLTKLAHKFKSIEQLHYHLSLQLIFEKSISKAELGNVLNTLKLVNYNNYYIKSQDVEILFFISEINNSPITSEEISTVLLNSELANLKNPSDAINAMCDFSAELCQFVNNRIIINSKVFSERDYNMITSKIRQLQNKAKIVGIELGGQLLQRYYA